MKAVFPGTFDPVTLGHVDIIKRAGLIFPHIIIAVSDNKNKKTLLSTEKRAELVSRVCQSISVPAKLEVISYSSMLIDLFEDEQHSFIIRGVRSNKDLSYENNMAHMNQQLKPKLDTLFFPSIAYAHVSSSLVREILLYEGDISPFVPPEVCDFINNES